MAITYEDRFGRAGGPNPALIKEYSTLLTTCEGNPSNNTVLLTDASSVPGGSEKSYYLIWGVTAVTDSTTAFFGMLYDTNVTHANNTVDAATYIGFGANVQGPFFWNTEHPLKVNDGSGVKIDVISSLGNFNTTITYSLIHP